MAVAPDFSDAELWIIKTTLHERYARAIETQIGDAEIRLNPGDRELTEVPLVHWLTPDGCNFVVFKTGDRRYRSQFYYKPYHQLGTGRYEYDDLSECMVTLLQTQADYAAKERGDLGR